MGNNIGFTQPVVSLEQKLSDSTTTAPSSALINSINNDVDSKIDTLNSKLLGDSTKYKGVLLIKRTTQKFYLGEVEAYAKGVNILSPTTATVYSSGEAVHAGSEKENVINSLHGSGEGYATSVAVNNAWLYIEFDTPSAVESLKIYALDYGNNKPVNTNDIDMYLVTSNPNGETDHLKLLNNNEYVGRTAGHSNAISWIQEYVNTAAGFISNTDTKIKELKDRKRTTTETIAIGTGNQTINVRDADKIVSFTLMSNLHSLEPISGRMVGTFHVGTTRDTVRCYIQTLEDPYIKLIASSVTIDNINNTIVISEYTARYYKITQAFPQNSFSYNVINYQLGTIVIVREE